MDIYLIKVVDQKAKLIAYKCKNNSKTAVAAEGSHKLQKSNLVGSCIQRGKKLM